VHDAGGHKKLKKLSIEYSEPTVDDLEGLASSFNQDFPALRQLEIHFINMDDLEREEMVRALTPLKNHPYLSRVKCGWYSQDDEGNFFRDFREALGGNIQVIKIPHYVEGYHSHPSAMH
jgi:hypothetical protein